MATPLPSAKEQQKEEEERRMKERAQASFGSSLSDRERAASSARAGWPPARRPRGSSFPHRQGGSLVPLHPHFSVNQNPLAAYILGLLTTALLGT